MKTKGIKTHNKMDGEDFLADTPKKPSSKKEINNTHLDGEDFLTDTDTHIKSFESFSEKKPIIKPINRKKQGDDYQKLDDIDCPEKSGKPMLEPVSRPKQGDIHQKIQSTKVKTNTKEPLHNKRDQQGDKYQRLSTGKMKSFESFIDENYADKYIAVEDGNFHLTNNRDEAIFFNDFKIFCRERKDH